MMHPVFLTWNDGYEALRATRLGSLGGRWDAYSFGSFTIAVIQTEHPVARTLLKQLHPDLVVMPGANGLLAKEHLRHIAKDFPLAKEGDAFRTVLSAVYKMGGIESFNPDNY